MSITYLALDIETTGLDRNLDQILEVAWKVLDEHLREIPEYESFSMALPLTGDGMARIISGPDVVRSMHSLSGLLGDVLGSRHEIDTIIRRLDSTLIKLHEKYERVHLLGMSIHFDAEFLKANGFERLFNDKHGIHHRMYDLTSVKLALAQAGIQWVAADKGNHRALNDVDEAIEQARIFHTLLRGLP